MGFDCRIYSRKVDACFELAGITQAVCKKDGAVVLGGNASCRFSVWAYGPLEVFEFNEGQDRPLEKLDDLFAKYSLDVRCEGLPCGMFCGGWIGYFEYELGRYIEKIPARAVDDLGMPIVRLAFYDKAVVYDHNERQWYLVVVQIEGDDCDAKFEELEGLLDEAKGATVKEFEVGKIDEIYAESIKRNMSKEYYLEAIEKIRKYIYDGEVYQINFSHRFECEFTAEPADLYHWQNQFNPSPYSAYLRFGEFAIVSASPEMFVTIDGDRIRTKPIKGTRSRVQDGEGAERINKINIRELIESEKEQAELNMIIDLERNDITRFCEYGTIKVVQPRTIEEYQTVYHAVATIEGRLREGAKFSDVLRGMYPGGSITGAPKIRAMEIIDELEPTCRGGYTGSIGFIGIDGTACLNIAIRTVIIKDGVAYAQSGGGIVADSDALAEWDETVVKARALVAGIQSVCIFAIENKED